MSCDSLELRLKLLAPVLVPQLRNLVRSAPPAVLAARLAPLLAQQLEGDAAAAGAVLAELGAQLQLLRPLLKVEV